MKTYKAKGQVYGNLWGGGQGAYPSEDLTGKTKAGLIQKAKKMLEDGSLDSGMGFNGLTGALLEIETYKTITQEGKEYSRSDYEIIFIGNLTEDQRNFLEKIHYQLPF